MSNADLAFSPRAALAALRKADPILGRLIKRAGPFTMRPEAMHNPFQSLLRSIVYQQLSGKAAATILGRVLALLPTERGGHRPEALLDLADTALRAAGLSFNKIAAVKDLAAKTIDGTVPTMAKLRRMPDDDIVAHLTAVRGIGVWTVEMMLMFRLGRPDVLPIGDLGVRRGYQLTYGKREMPKPKHLFAAGERWRPYRSVASWYFYRAVDLERASAAKEH